MRPSRLDLASFVLAALVALSACSDPSTIAPPSANDAVLEVQASVSGTLIAVVVVQVTASDIPTPLLFDIPISNGVAAGAITVPAGSSRTVTLRAYDTGGVLTDSGTVTLDIQSGANPTLSILLTPLTGNLPITATLGEYTVTVAPALDSLGTGANSLNHPLTAQLTATLKDTQGNPASGTVTWATLNPGVATVSSSGLVTATGPGTTTVGAVFQGVTATATIIVTQ
jgi:hypothetical protein